MSVLTISTVWSFLFASGFCAYAQVNRLPCQWIGDLLSVEDAQARTDVYIVDENNTIIEKIRSNGSNFFSLSASAPGESNNFVLSSVWRNGVIYSLASNVVAPEKDVNGTLYRRFTFAKWQDGEWHDLGSYKNPHTRSVMQAIPCDNGHFIVISNNVDLSGNTGSRLTPFARMSLNPEKEEVRVHSSIDHGQDELRQYMSNTDCFRLAYGSQIIVTGNHATLLNYSTGLYWVFSMETANLKKAGKIFKKMTPEMIAKGGLTNAILCAHPEKEGTILISAQAEELFESHDDYVAEMRELHKQHNVGRPHATMAFEDWAILYDKRERQATVNNPLIDWYRLNPESGKAEKTFPPEGAAIERDGLKNDLWYPRPDGSIRMGVLVLRLKEPENAEA